MEPISLQQSYAVPRTFIGFLEPRQDTSLGFEAGGTISEILVEEGDTVAAGNVLARLDTRNLEAQKARQTATRDALTAQAELAQLTLNRQQALADRSFASQQRVDETRLGLAELKARIAEADAGLAEIEIAIDKADIRAPFDGIIAARLVDAGTRVGPSATVLNLQEDTNPQVRIGLSAYVAATLQPGDTVTIDFGDISLPGHFASRGSQLNPVTRTVDVRFDLDRAGTTLPYGSVARLSVEQTVQGLGAWLPLSALTEGTRGLWTVYYVENGQVVREAVEVLYADETRAYVRGALPDGARLIASGTHRVSAGQSVLTEEG